MNHAHNDGDMTPFLPLFLPSLPLLVTSSQTISLSVTTTTYFAAHKLAYVSQLSPSTQL